MVPSFWILFLFAKVLFTSGCSITIGEADLSAFTWAADGQTAQSYLMEEGTYRVPDSCTCGVIKQWSFSAQDTGSIEFQVWRRTDVSTYTLVGENTFTVPASAVGNTITYQVAQRDLITVEKGDYIGWYCPANNVIGFVDGDVSYPDGLRRGSVETGSSTYSKGSTFNWNAASITTLYNYRFGIQTSIVSKSRPCITNLPRSVIVYQDWAVNSDIYQIEIADIGNEDDLITLTQTTQTEYFSLDQSTRWLSLHTLPTTVGSYTATFQLEDTCSNTVTADLNVQFTNVVVKINNLPASAEISETATTETLLYTIDYTEPVDTVMCTIASGDPDATNFEVKYTAGSGAAGTYGVYSKQNPSFDYDTTKKYELNIRCSDQADSDEEILYVEILKNSPPEFTNLGNNEKAYVSYLTTKDGDLVFTVSASDAENDALTFSMTSTPTTSIFEVNNAGELRTTDEMIRLYEPAYDLEFTVSDGDTDVDKGYLTVIVNDIDDVPVITTLPLDHPLYVDENTAAGTSVFRVLFNDRDTGDTHHIYATFNPLSGSNFFTLNSSTGIISTSTTHNIDFEDMGATSFILDVFVTDFEDTATATLTISIGDVNETPAFHQSRYDLSISEQGVSGTVAGTPGFIIYDDDNGDSQLFSFECGDPTKYFVMDRTTGDVKYGGDFDLDTAGISGNINCTVTVTDSQGLTATAVLQLEIADDNDNAPVFSQSWDYQFFISPSISVDEFVGQVSASDADATTYFNTVYYDLDLSPFSDQYFAINSSGHITIKKTLDQSFFDYGTLHTFEVVAKNIEGADTTATATIILAQTTTTTTTTTDRPIQFLEDTRNIAWLMPEATIALGITILLFIYGFAFCKSLRQFKWKCRCWRKSKEQRKKERALKREQIRKRRQLRDGTMEKLEGDVEHSFINKNQETKEKTAEKTKKPKVLSNISKTKSRRQNQTVADAQNQRRDNNESTVPIKTETEEMGDNTDNVNWTEESSNTVQNGDISRPKGGESETDVPRTDSIEELRKIIEQSQQEENGDQTQNTVDPNTRNHPLDGF